MDKSVRMSLSVLGTNLTFENIRMRNFWEAQEPISMMTELEALYSDLTEYTSPTLCETCQALEIDSSSFGGSIRSCKEDRNGCEHLFFSRLPRDVNPVDHNEFMSLPVRFERKDSLPKLPSLKESAANGCQFCSLLISTLQNRRITVIESTESTISITNAQYEWHADLDSEMGWKTKHGSLLPAVSLHLFSLRVQVDGSQPFKLWFRISAPPILPSLWLGIQRRLPLEFPSSDDGDGRFTFKSWLDEHTKACNACQAPTRAQYPTRLIDVGNPSGLVDPRLVLTKDHPHIFNPVGWGPPKYLALSYCWGENPSTTHLTTNKNLLEHFQRIPLEDFPTTCRDAVIVTRSLGFRYLWIDACCIIQDDDKDWQRESRKLSDIYSNAFLTIIPLSSESSSDGFLPARSKSARISFRPALKQQFRGEYWMHELPIDSEDYDPKDFQRRIQLASPALDHISAHEELINSKWETRGWTFNEAVMSPRKLKFGARSVTFEYYGRQFVERALGRGVPIVDGLYNYDWMQSMGKHNDPREIVGRYWTGGQYHISHRLFTRPTDRLPAISSFAQYVQEKTGGEYVAGLFRCDLHRGLTWGKKMKDKCEGFKSHAEKSYFGLGKSYVGPSWSWVSTPLSSYSLHAWAFATIIDADCDIEAEVQLENEDNPFGRVKSGQLVLISKAYRSDSMQLYTQEEKFRLKDNAGFEAEMDLDWSIQLGPDKNLLISDCRWDENHPLWKSQGPLSGMHLVPLIQKEDGSETIGLVIIPFPNQPAESWMRAGIFKSKEPWESFEKCPRKRFLVL